MSIVSIVQDTAYFMLLMYGIAAFSSVPNHADDEDHGPQRGSEVLEKELEFCPSPTLPNKYISPLFSTVNHGNILAANCGVKVCSV